MTIRLTKSLPLNPSFGAVKGRTFEVYAIHDVTGMPLCMGDCGRTFAVAAGEFEVVG